MNFWFGGEIDALAYDAWREVRGPVEDRLNAALGARKYGSAVHKIALLPMINSPATSGAGKERRLFKRSEGWADYRTVIDFDAFIEGDTRRRERLIIANLVDAIRDIGRKAGKGFDAEELVDDVLLTMQMSASELVAAR
jgi:hypothetical protein